MSNIPFRSDQVVEELVQFNQNLSKGVKNLLDTDEISAGVTPREEIYAEDNEDEEQSSGEGEDGQLGDDELE